MHTRRRIRIILLAILLLASLLLVVGTAQAFAGAHPTTSGAMPAPDQRLAPSLGSDALTPIVRHALQHDLSPPLRSILPKLPIQRVQIELPRNPLPGREGDRKPQAPSGAVDPIVQSWQGATSMPAPIQSFNGLDNNDNLAIVGLDLMPPDTQGDVGPNHYVQWVNLTLAIWGKSGNLLYGPVPGNTMWSGFGGPCEGANDGDPITLYDPLADRWLMGQFALPYYPNGPFYQCLAVSASGDPTGPWHRYAFEWENADGLDVMNDYPKLGVWPDGYYMTANQFAAGTGWWSGTGVAAFEREEMLDGGDARMVYFDLGPADWGGMLPADLDGPTPPPAGAPNYFVEAHADEWDLGLDDELLLYEFHVDWANPSNSTFLQAATLPMAPFDGVMCGFSRDCIPQPGTYQRLDSLADRLMHRLQYRNFGSHEALVSNLTVDVDGTDHAGIRWFELRRSGASWSIFQEGTYAPGDDQRWMGSIAMDRVGNIALGYSLSSNSTYPSIRYAGRLADDPPGTLPQAEVELAAGSWYQAGGNRWGDYSMMAVDPVDDCTFWYTQEYVAAPGSWGNWDTRIGSFRFPGCSEPTGELAGVVEEAGSGTPIAGAKVTAETDRKFTTYSQSPDGAYRFEAIPTGSYALTVEAYGHRPQTFTGVEVISGSTTVQDVLLAEVDTYVLEGTVTDAITGWPLYASLQIDGYPGDAIWTDPVTGFYSVTLAAETEYTIEVNAWVDGYQPASRDVGPLTGTQIEDFELEVDTEACIAPGYRINVLGIYERFENDGLPPDGWTVVDNAGKDQVWSFDNPHNRDNLTGGSGDFAIVDSDHHGSDGQQDTELHTPSMDLSELDSVLLEFDTDYLTFNGDDVADVDVSTNGGGSWTNVWRRTGSNYRGPRHEVIPITTEAAGESDVIVRFHYYDASWEFWWQVDNVLVGENLGCQSQPGGLVVGNVYDDNTGEPLVGAVVAREGDGSSTTEATPLDPDVDDGFYTLFSPAGSQAFTATGDSGYGPDNETVSVVEGSTVRQDFSLPTGWLAYNPETIDRTLAVDGNTVVSLAVSNQGSLPLEFEITEIDLGFQQEGPVPVVEVTIPGTEISYGPDARLAKRHTVFRPDISFTVEEVWRPLGAIPVLLLTPDKAAGGDISVIQTTLGAFPDLDVALWDAALGNPTGADLMAYDIVIAGNDYKWGNAGMTANGVGDALADYIDAGGKVIDTLFLHDYAGWQMGGRYANEGYAPLTASTTDMTATPYSLGTVYNPGHPIMDGVTAIKDNPSGGIGHQNVGLAPGATRLADWNDGEIFIAYNEDVVGVNQLWYHGANWTGDVPKLMHNAILYLAGGDVDWVSIEPISGTLEIDGQQVLSVTLDAGAPSVVEPGSYLAKLNLKNNTAYGNPAVAVTMTVESDCSPVTDVDLALLPEGATYVDTPVEFSADIVPDGFGAPYNYAIDYGDGTEPTTGSSSNDPLLFEHAYSEEGTYSAEVAIWNCSMTEAEAVTDSVTVSRYYRYLPSILRDQ